jgi:large subunit ribosomal protein L7/L12
MSDITKDQVIDWLSSQSVIEIADLVKELEDKWGVSAAAPAAVAVAAPAAGGDGGAAA